MKPLKIDKEIIHFPVRTCFYCNKNQGSHIIIFPKGVLLDDGTIQFSFEYDCLCTICYLNEMKRKV